MKNNYKKYTLEKEKLSLIIIHTEQQIVVCELLNFRHVFLENPNTMFSNE